MIRKKTTLRAKQGHNRDGHPSQLIDETVYRERQSGVPFDAAYAGWSWATRPRDYAITLRTRVGSRGPSGASGPTGSTGVTPPPTQFVDLFSAGDFAIFSEAGISDTVAMASLVFGDMGVSPAVATSITNFALNLPPASPFSTSAQVFASPNFPTQLGQVFAPDYAAPTPLKVSTAQTDRLTVYNDAIGRPVLPINTFAAGDINDESPLTGGLVYRWTGAASATAGPITINGGVGDGIIIQVMGTLDLQQDVVLVGGILPENVYFAVSGALTIDPGVTVNGQLLAATNIAMGAGAILNGRALAGTAVTLDNNTINEM